MSVKKEASGRRSVQVEVEIPGTPEEVWQAIATGPGISCWFVPAKFEEQGGKPAAVTMNFGPGMVSTSKIAKWDPPRMFVAQGEGWGGSPPMATEWSVETRGAGVCLVRVVHSLFASTDEWDNQLEGTEHGWPSFFRILQLYQTHFRGQRCSSIRVMASGSDSESKAWEAMTTGLGIKGAAVGQRWTAPPGVPTASGIVEPLGSGQHPNNVLIRLDQPTTGIGSFCAYACQGMVMALAYLYLYGDEAKNVAARDESMWRKWMGETLPTPTEPSKRE